MIPYSTQEISDDDVAAVVAALRSSRLTQGPEIEAFEAAVAEYCGVRFAVAVSSGTAALHLVCQALDLREGDEVWTSPNSFVASANCALYCGARAGFVDIDPESSNLDLESLRVRLESTRNRPKLLLPVHFGGRAVPMRAVAELAREHGVAVVEDASHALGASDEGVRVGSCRHSVAAVFSFHPVKMITTGEGGMVVTNDRALYERLRRARTHGITRDPARMRQASPGPWYYEQLDLGFNYRMTDLQAALGRSQLRRLDGFLERRRELAARYDSLLAGLPVRCPPPSATSSWHLYVVRIPAASADRDRVFLRMREAGIGVNVHYLPIHRQPFYDQQGFREGDFPEAEAHGREALTLPLFPAMTHEQQDRIVRCLGESLG